MTETDPAPPPPPSPDDMFDKEGAGDFLLVHARTIERLIANGELDFVKVGNRVRITRRALLDYQHRHLTKATANQPKAKR